MLALSNDDLRARADAIIAALGGLPVTATVGQGKAQIGGGTLPRSVIPSVTVDLRTASLPLAEFAARLRAATPPVVGYVSGGRLKLDLRTVFPRQDELLVQAVRAAFSRE